jgi:hypothetical protein
MFKILINEHNKMSLGNTLLVSEYKANKNKKINNNNENNNEKQYHFAVCKTCFWTATFLRIKRIMNNDISNYDTKSISCPVCFDRRSISLIPLMAH